MHVTLILLLQCRGAANTAVTGCDELPQCTIVWKVGRVPRAESGCRAENARVQLLLAS